MKDIVQRKLDSYNCQTSLDQESALKEIAQELLLYGLSLSGFFDHASFQGGTCLRILHGLDRFSEDLDFALHQPDLDFESEIFLRKACESLRNYGFDFEISGENRADSSVQSRFLKDESVKSVLQLQHSQNPKQKLQIKFELDVNPPDGALHETKFLDFPIDHSIKTHDLSSLFAGKSHALLCREYVKGRDWYDFAWYVGQGVTPRWNMLAHALQQSGHWKDASLETFSSEFFFVELQKKIETQDWSKVRKDVERFLKPERVVSLDLWGVEFFMDRLKKLKRSS